MARLVLLVYKTGRELMPLRYDQIIFFRRNGLACAIRQGRAFVLDHRGRPRYYRGA